MRRSIRRKKPRPDPEKQKQVLQEAAKRAAERARGYRERALALFPHVCGRCGREFAGDRLHELTVHHRDHNHDNNPPDGSNWELLCVYCHDDEHQDPTQRSHAGPKAQVIHQEDDLSHNPFAKLKAKLSDEDRSD